MDNGNGFLVGVLAGCLFLMGMAVGMLAFDISYTETTFSKGWAASQNNPMKLSSHQNFTLQKNNIDPTTNKSKEE